MRRYTYRTQAVQSSLTISESALRAEQLRKTPFLISHLYLPFCFKAVAYACVQVGSALMKSGFFAAGGGLLAVPSSSSSQGLHSRQNSLSATAAAAASASGWFGSLSAPSPLEGAFPPASQQVSPLASGAQTPLWSESSGISTAADWGDMLAASGGQMFDSSGKLAHLQLQHRAAAATAAAIEAANSQAVAHLAADLARGFVDAWALAGAFNGDPCAAMQTVDRVLSPTGVLCLRPTG